MAKQAETASSPGRELRKQLDQTHPDYDRYIARWQMLADMWDGTGGVASPYDNIVADDGEQLGERFTPLPDWKGITYLDRYTRESLKHFLGRIRTACYENHLRDIGETILGFVERRPPEIKGLPPWLDEWTKTAGSRKRPLSALRRSIRTNMLRFGCCPVLIDRSASRARTEAEAKTLGVRTYALPYQPQSLRGWNLVDDGWDWVLLKDIIVRWVDPDEAPQQVERWIRWDRKEWIRWEAIDDGDPQEVAREPHKLGRVPLVLFQFSEPATDSPIPAPPLLGVAETGRRRFNVQSEKTDVLRGFGSPIFIYPVPKGGTIKAIKAGTDAAVPGPTEGNEPKFLTLDAAVLAGYTDELDRLLVAMYQQARNDFGLGQTSAPESGYAKAQRFQRANTQLVQFSGNEADGLRDVFDCVAKWEGKVAAAELAELNIITATDFDLRDLDRELAQGEVAARINLGPTAMAQIKKNLRNGLVDFEDPKDLKKSDDEIDAEAAAKGTYTPPSGQADVPFGRAPADEVPPAPPPPKEQPEEPPAPPAE